jgi:hypothetical protein
MDVTDSKAAANVLAEETDWLCRSAGRFLGPAGSPDAVSRHAETGADEICDRRAAGVSSRLGE